MILRPINDRVIIRPLAPEEKTKGGLIIPDTAKTEQVKGYAIAVGKGKDGNLMTVAEGDLVIYGKYAGQEIEFGSEKYIVVREDEILAIIERE